MKWKSDIIFWVLVFIVLLLVFGSTSGNFSYAFYFLCFFMPVLLITSWVFNTVIVPNYLLRKRYREFFLYTIALIIVSLDLEFLIVFLAFILIALYDYENMSLIIDSYKWMPVIMFLIVLISGFIQVVSKLMARESAAGENTENPSLVVRADRKNRVVRFDEIAYVESMSDYVKIILKGGETVITREKISHLEEKFPEQFLRIHRSYIVNMENMDSFSREFIVYLDKELPISRTYKAEAMQRISRQLSDSIV